MDGRWLGLGVALAAAGLSAVRGSQAGSSVRTGLSQPIARHLYGVDLVQPLPFLVFDPVSRKVASIGYESVPPMGWKLDTKSFLGNKVFLAGSWTSAPRAGEHGQLLDENGRLLRRFAAFTPEGLLQRMLGEEQKKLRTDAEASFQVIEELAHGWAAKAAGSRVRTGLPKPVPVFLWDDPTELDAFPNDPDGRADAKGVVLDDFKDHLGTVGLAPVIFGYIGSSSVDLVFEPPLRVEVLPTDRDSLLNNRENFFDPNWNVRILDPLPRRDARGAFTDGLSLESTWIDGPSVRMRTV